MRVPRMTICWFFFGVVARPSMRVPARPTVIVASAEEGAAAGAAADGTIPARTATMDTRMRIDPSSCFLPRKAGRGGLSCSNRPQEGTGGLVMDVKVEDLLHARIGRRCLD